MHTLALSSTTLRASSPNESLLHRQTPGCKVDAESSMPNREPQVLHTLRFGFGCPKCFFNAQVHLCERPPHYRDADFD